MNGKRASGDGSEGALAEAFRHAPEPMAVTGADGAIQHANHALTELFGRGAAELTGRLWYELLEPADVEPGSRAHQDAQAATASPRDRPSRIGGEARRLHDRSFVGVGSINGMDNLHSFVRPGTGSPRSNRDHRSAVIRAVLSFDLMNMTKVGCGLETFRQFEFPFQDLPFIPIPLNFSPG